MRHPLLFWIIWEILKNPSFLTQKVTDIRFWRAIIIKIKVFIANAHTVTLEACFSAMWSHNAVKHYQHRCSEGGHTYFLMKHTVTFIIWANTCKSSAECHYNCGEHVRGSVPQSCTWQKACADVTVSAHARLAQLGQPRLGDVPLALCHRRS